MRWDKWRTAERIALDTAPLIIHAGVEAVALAVTHDAVLATGAGDVAEVLTSQVVQRILSPPVKLPQYSQGPVVIAPIPDPDMAPGYFVYVLGVTHRDDGTWVSNPQAVQSTYPQFFSTRESAREFAQQVAVDLDLVDTIERIDQGSIAQVAWSLWVDQRHIHPFADDWYYREKVYHIGEIAHGAGSERSAFLIWQGALTNVGRQYFVLDAGDTMTPQGDPWVTPDRNVALERLAQVLDKTPPISPIDYVPDALERTIQITWNNFDRPQAHRLVRPLPAIQVSGSRPLGVVQIRAPDGDHAVDTHPAWYLSPMIARGHQDPVWFAWQPSRTTESGEPSHVVVALDAADPQRLLAWSSSDRGLSYLAAIGFWAQIHPQIIPVEPVQSWADTLRTRPKVSL